MEHKTFPFEVMAADPKTGIFEGYASTFNNIDDGGDVVLPGAFKKTLAERMGRVKVCWQHDWKQPIGKPVEMREDEHGLYVKALISDTSLGRDVRTLMKDGVVNELSIGYDVIKDSWNEVAGQPVRALHEIRLYEFSPVTFAMNPAALVTGVKQEQPSQEPVEDTAPDSAVAEPPSALTTHDDERKRLELKLRLTSLEV